MTDQQTELRVFQNPVNVVERKMNENPEYWNAVEALANTSNQSITSLVASIMSWQDDPQKAKHGK